MTLPSYSMQTNLFPRGICNSVDSKCQKFLWGSLNLQRKINLVPWNEVCQPKEKGGLGIRPCQPFNEAYFMKLAWDIISNPNALWVRILVAKYCKNGIQNISVQNSANSSPLWKGILKVWEKVVQGTR